jgi:DNA-binding CsgD family transcriptional regulator
VAEPNEPLTERELEVVKLVASGASNKQIASSLFISENTVKVHLKNIFVKLEVENRARVAAIAQRNGWIDDPAAEAIAIATERVVDVVPSHQAPARVVDDTPVPAEAAPAIALQADAIPIVPPPAPRPARVVVPVAPNPLPRPALPIWKRVAALLTMLGIVLGGLFSLQLNRGIAAPVVDPDFTESQGNTGAVSASRRWISRLPLPAARTRSVAFGAPNGLIYVVGGAVNRAASAETLIYDTRRDEWRVTADKPTPLRLAAGAIISNVIYMPGGLDANGAPTDRFEVFDATSEKWSERPRMPRAISGHIVSVLGDRLFVFGGRAANESLNRDGFMFDFKNSLWIRIAGMPTPRSQAAAAVIGDRIYVVGGTDGQREFTTCEVYDPRENRWASCKPMFIGRGGFGLASVAGGLYAIGGGVANTYIPYNERYDAAKDRWTRFEIPADRAGVWKNIAIASMPTEFYVIGGSTGNESRNDNFVFEVLTERSFLPQPQNTEKR